MAIQTADVIMPGNENAFETGRRGQISSIAELDESYRWLLEKNVTATLATIKRNGLPQLTPIWVAHDGVNIVRVDAVDELQDGLLHFFHNGAPPVEGQSTVYHAGDCRIEQIRQGCEVISFVPMQGTRQS